MDVNPVKQPQKVPVIRKTERDKESRDKVERDANDKPDKGGKRDDGSSRIDTYA